MTLALAGASAVLPLATLAQPLQQQAVETITIRLSSFAFTPDQLTLRANVPVRLHLVNVSSGGHNFSAPTFFTASTFPSSLPPKDGKVEVPAKGSVDITLVPRAPGTYKLECTHFLHSLFGMTGTIKIVAP